MAKDGRASYVRALTLYVLTFILTVFILLDTETEMGRLIRKHRSENDLTAFPGRTVGCWDPVLYSKDPVAVFGQPTQLLLVLGCAISDQVTYRP